MSEIRLNTTCEVHRLAFRTCLFPRLPVLQFGAAFSSPTFSVPPGEIVIRCISMVAFTHALRCCALLLCAGKTLLVFLLSQRSSAQPSNAYRSCRWRQQLAATHSNAQRMCERPFMPICLIVGLNVLPPTKWSHWSERKCTN